MCRCCLLLKVEALTCICDCLQVVKKTLAPEWNEDFELSVAEAESDVLELHCSDWDRFAISEYYRLAEADEQQERDSRYLEPEVQMDDGTHDDGGVDPVGDVDDASESELELSVTAYDPDVSDGPTDTAQESTDESDSSDRGSESGGE